MRIASLAVVILAWGLWGMLSKLAQGQIGWRTSALVFSAAQTLLLLAFWRPEPVRVAVGYATAVAAGVAIGIGTVLFFRLLTVEKAGPLVAVTAAYPIITALLAWWLLAEAPSPREWLGIVLVVGGVIVLQWR